MAMELETLSNAEEADNVMTNDDAADNKKNGVGVAIQEIKEGQWILINFGFYLGMIPVYMDKATWTVHKVTSKWKLAVFATMQCILLMHRVAVTFSFVRDYLDGRINMSTSYDAVHSMNIAGSLFTGFLHLHTVWKGRDIAPLINTMNQSYTHFEEQFGTACGPRNRKLYGKLLKAYFCCAVLGTLGVVVMYISHCHFHHDTRFLNVCKIVTSNSSPAFVSRIHMSISRMVIFSATQLFSMGEEFVATFLYIAFAVPAILTILEMVTALKSTDDGSYFYDHGNWLIHYKSVQVIVGQINDFTQALLMPGHISLIIILIVFSNYVIIRAELDHQVRGGLIIIDVMCCGFVGILFGIGGKITASAGEALASTKALLVGRGKFARREWNALKEIRIGIGRMRYLDRESTIIVYGAIIDNTVDMLLTVE